MYNNRPHHVLEQVPLTVSPFVSLPTSTTLSYNYKTMPSTVPPSSLGIGAASSDDPASQPKPRYVVSGSGHAAHPDEIRASCTALREYVCKMQEESDRELRAFEERIRERELAEKRRVAPGWLDSESRMLEPEKAAGTEHSLMDDQSEEQKAAKEAAKEAADEEGAQLDRAFGGMALK